MLAGGFPAFFAESVCCLQVDALYCFSCQTQYRLGVVLLPVGACPDEPFVQLVAEANIFLVLKGESLRVPQVREVELLLILTKRNNRAALGVSIDYDLG